MYPVSDLALQVIRSDDRSFQWIGNITLSDGTVHNFDMSNIVQGSGSLRQSCNAPGIGEAASTELTVQMFLDDVDVESLKNAVIGLTCRIISRIDIDTWGDAFAYTWSDVNGVQWGADQKTLSTDVPLGIFNVKKAKRAMDSIRITAYDNMQKFDQTITSLGTASRSPLSWLNLVCSRCGVPLGISSYTLATFPNGTREMVFAESDSTITTYRDVIQQIAAALCATAVMDRMGRLTLVPCAAEPILEFAPSDRFSSEFEDYKTTYTGLYAQYQVSGIQEYYKNTTTAKDTGSIIDLGINPFLQISKDSVRKAAVQSIADKFKDFAITPFDISIPHDPTLELMDVISFTGNHAPSNAQAPITDLTMTLNGDVQIRCEVGETAEGLLRKDKEMSGGGISGDSASSGISYGSGSFWLNIASFPENSATITQDTITTTLDVDITIENTRTQIAWTGFYSLDDSALVTAKIYVDSTLVYTIQDAQTAGHHTLNVTTGYELTKKGKINFRVVLGVSDGSTITIGKEASRLTVLGYGWGETSIDSGEALTFEEEFLKDLAEITDMEFEDADGNPIDLDDIDWSAVANNPEYEPIEKEDIVKVDPKTGEEYEYDDEQDEYVNEDGEVAPDNAEQYVNPDAIDRGLEKIKKTELPDGTRWTGGGTTPTSPTYHPHNGSQYVNPSGGSGGSSGGSGGTTTNSSPYAIKITTKPTKLNYNSGETIDTGGMVVTAYDEFGSVWTHTQYPSGVVPLSEILISPEKAP